MSESEAPGALSNAERSLANQFERARAGVEGAGSYKIWFDLGDLETFAPEIGVTILQKMGRSDIANPTSIRSEPVTISNSKKRGDSSPQARLKINLGGFATDNSGKPVEVDVEFDLKNPVPEDKARPGGMFAEAVRAKTKREGSFVLNAFTSQHVPEIENMLQGDAVNDVLKETLERNIEGATLAGLLIVDKDHLEIELKKKEATAGTVQNSTGPAPAAITHPETVVEPTVEEVDAEEEKIWRAKLAELQALRRQPLKDDIGDIKQNTAEFAFYGKEYARVYLLGAKGYAQEIKRKEAEAAAAAASARTQLTQDSGQVISTPANPSVVSHHPDAEDLAVAKDKQETKEEKKFEPTDADKRFLSLNFSTDNARRDILDAWKNYNAISGGKGESNSTPGPSIAEQRAVYLKDIDLAENSYTFKLEQAEIDLPDILSSGLSPQLAEYRSILAEMTKVHHEMTSLIGEVSVLSIWERRYDKVGKDEKGVDYKKQREVLIQKYEELLNQRDRIFRSLTEIVTEKPDLRKDESPTAQPEDEGTFTADRTDTHPNSTRAVSRDRIPARTAPTVISTSSSTVPTTPPAVAEADLPVSVTLPSVEQHETNKPETPMQWFLDAYERRRKSTVILHTVAKPDPKGDLAERYFFMRKRRSKDKTNWFAEQITYFASGEKKGQYITSHASLANEAEFEEKYVPELMTRLKEDQKLEPQRVEEISEELRQQLESAKILEVKVRSSVAKIDKKLEVKTEATKSPVEKFFDKYDPGRKNSVIVSITKNEDLNKPAGQREIVYLLRRLVQKDGQLQLLNIELTPDGQGGYFYKSYPYSDVDPELLETPPNKPDRPGLLPEAVRTKVMAARSSHNETETYDIVVSPDKQLVDNFRKAKKKERQK